MSDLAGGTLAASRDDLFGDYYIHSLMNVEGLSIVGLKKFHFS